MQAKLSILGLYNYDQGLFDGMILPDHIDRETLVDNILLQTSDFEALYPDAVFMRQAIRLWSAKWYNTFDKWQRALEIEYDPLENYDRREEWDDAGSGKSRVTGKTTDETDIETTETVSAYNTTTLQPNRRNESHSESESSLDNTNTSETTNRRTGRAHGNIGVTTSQQMLKSELDIAKWSIYEHITDVFIDEFCIAVY